MTYSAADLQMVEDHIAQGRRHVLQQEQLIVRLRTRGLPTDKAEDLLAEFEATLQQHRHHRELMIRNMAGEA